MLESSRKNAKLETDNHEAKQTIQHYEETINNLRKYSEDIVAARDTLVKERDMLYLEKQNFQRDICNLQFTLEKERETATNLKKTISNSENTKSAAIDECRQIRKAYRTIENSLTRLSMEHVSLQSAYTNTEKEMTQLQLQIESVKLENTKIKQEKRQAKEELGIICNQLTIATESYSTKEKDLIKEHELLNTLYQELDKLRNEIIKLEYDSHSQNVSALSDTKLLKQLLENITGQRDQLLHNNSVTEASLRHEIERSNNVQSELDTLRETKVLLTKASETSKHLHQKVSIAYNQLISTLDSTLNIGICTGTGNTTKDENCSDSNLTEEWIALDTQLVEESIQSRLAEYAKQYSELINKAEHLVKEKEYYLIRCNEMETKINQLQHTNAKMESMVKQLTAKNQEFETSVSSSQKDNAILESGNIALEKQVELAHENLKLAQLSCKASDIRYEKASKNLFKTDNESRKLEQELKKMMTHEKLLEEQLANSMKQVTILSDTSSQEKAEHTQKREYLHDLVDSLNKENNCLKNSLQEKDNALSDKLRDIANRKDELNTLQRKLSSVENAAHDDEEKMKHKVEKLLELIKLSEENYSGLQKQMEVMTIKTEEEKSNVNSQLVLCTIQLEESETKLRELVMQVQNMQQQSCHVLDEDMHKTLKSEVTKLKKELHDSRERTWELQYRLEKLLEQGIQTDFQQKQSFTVKNMELTAKITELEKALEDCKQNCSMQ